MRQRITAIHLDSDDFKEKLEIAITDTSRLQLRGDITLDHDGVCELVEDLTAFLRVMTT